MKGQVLLKVTGLFAFCLIAMGFPLAAQAQSSAIGTVVAIEGEATVELGGGGEARTIRQGDIIRAGDRVRTGPAGKIRIVMKDESILLLGSNATLDFGAFDYDAARGSRSAVLNLIGGTLRAIITKLKAYGNRFEVKTATATIGVRGTHLIVSVDPDTGETQVLVIEGRVTVTNNDPSAPGTVTLGTMEQSEVREGQPPAPGHVPSDQTLGTMREQTEVKFSPDITPAMSPLSLPSPLATGSSIARQALLDSLVDPPQAPGAVPQAKQDPTKGTLEIRW
ncbi:MAG: FecR domain-containing protein [Nitrospirae bacterium]|nr:FecR domain-containing protein [Nitrospirota bacterium]